MKATAKHRLETLFAIDCPWTPVLGQAWMSFAIFLGIFSFSSQAQLISVTTEVDTAFYAPTGDGFDPLGLLDGYVTYGVYANFTNPTDMLSAMLFVISRDKWESRFKVTTGQPKGSFCLRNTLVPSVWSGEVGKHANQV